MRRWQLHHRSDLGFDGNCDITIGRVGPVRCAATAADGDQCLAMLVRRPGESLMQLLRRLDAAIEDACENGIYIDESTRRQIPDIGRLRPLEGARCCPLMLDLLDEMQLCKSVPACIELALTGAYGEDEQAVAWLTCIGTMFG